MKKLSSFATAAALLLGLLAARAGRAQSAITLTQATFPAAPGVTERYQNVGSTTYPATPTGANRAWDYRSLPPAGTFAQPYLALPPGPTPIAGAQWTRARRTTLGTYYYDYTAYDALAPTGRLLLGRTVARQPLSLGSRTGTATDSIVIDRQTVLYNGSTGVVDFPLPLTTGGYANRAFRFGVTGLLTVQAYGLNRAPFRIVQRYQYVDSVAGWGTLRIPVAGLPNGSAAQSVLQVRSRTIRRDSVYLNGSPAPAALLQLFNLTQGAVTTTYFDWFWRAGSAQPLLELYYPSRTFGTPYAADYSTEPTLLATREVALASVGFVVWPNPARAGQPVQVALAAAPAGQLLHLTVRDALGRAVAQGTTLPGQPTSLLQALPAGLYLLEADTPTGLAVRRVAVE